MVESVAYESYCSFFEFLGGYLVGMVFIIPSGGVWVEGCGWNPVHIKDASHITEPPHQTSTQSTHSPSQNPTPKNQLKLPMSTEQ